jgi:hypothetical protein
MGGCGVAASREAAAIWINPAQLARMSSPQLSFMHGLWVEGVSVDQLAVGHPTPIGSLAGAFASVRAGSIDAYDASGNLTGKFSPSDISVTGAYAFSWNMLALGAAGTWLKSDLADGVGTTAEAFDAGASLTPYSPLTVSVAVLHLGTALDYGSKSQSLPMTIRGGGSFDMTQFGATVAAEAVKPADGGLVIRIGAEKGFAAGRGLDISLRGGWRGGAPTGGTSGLSAGGGLRWRPLLTDSDDPTSSRIQGFSGVEQEAGSGYRIAAVGVDYAWTPMGELGSAHWFSVALIF